jgi:hypothetical protein
MFIWISFSCAKDEITIPECYCGNPIEEWVNQEIANCKDGNPICHTSILQGLYNDMPVFFSDLHGALCDPVFRISLRDCTGDTIKEYSYTDQQKFYEEVKIVKVLYTCPRD